MGDLRSQINLNITKALPCGFVSGRKGLSRTKPQKIKKNLKMKKGSKSQNSLISKRLNLLLLGSFGVGKIPKAINRPKNSRKPKNLQIQKIDKLTPLGKSSITCKFLFNVFNEENYIPTVEDKYDKPYIVDGEKIELSKTKQKIDKNPKI